MDVLKVVKRFPNQEACVLHLERVRWGRTALCPYCGSKNVSKELKADLRRRCYNCARSFSVTVGTLFHHTHVPLQKWMVAIYLILNARKGISSLHLSRTIGVNKDTAWRMAMKLRKAMSNRQGSLILRGILEMDETFVGGKPRKFDWTRKPGSGNTNKPPVIGIIERGGRVVAKRVRTKRNLRAGVFESLLRRKVDLESSRLMTDEHQGYRGMHRLIDHSVIRHGDTYVDGDVHTNTIESFWAIVKRSVMGQFHYVSKRYLQLYMDEVCYRYNLRHTDPNVAFDSTVQLALSTQPVR